MKTVCKNIHFIFLLIGTLLFLLPAVAQTSNTGYFMTSHHNRTSLNPALRPENGYIGVPGLSNICVDYKTNSLNLETFMFPGGPAGSLKNSVTFLHEGITTEQFMSNIFNNNYANFDVDWTFAGAGFYKDDGFWFVDLGIRAYANFNAPYDLFNFAKQGLTDSNGELVEGYDMKNIRGTATCYFELGVGHSRSFLDDKLVVGLKAKALFGLANGNLRVNKLDLNTGIDKWTVDANAAFEGTLPGFVPDYDEDGLFNGFKKEGHSGISGFGLGFDLGATYKLSCLADALNNEIFNRFTFSAAFTDIGFIGWSSKRTMYLATKKQEKPVTIAGDFIISTNGEGESLGDQIEVIFDKLKDAVNLEETGKNSGRTTGLRTKMNWGLEYEIIENQLSAGILSTTYFTPVSNVTEFTLAGAYKPVNWFEAGLSYSFVYGNFKTFGLALNFVPSKGVNVFLASDYLIPRWNSDFIPTTSKAVNFQVGLTIPLESKKTS